MKTVAEVTSMSSKGQIVLPKKIRNQMELKSGAKFVVITDGDNILLKPIQEPSLEEFDAIMDESKKWSAEVGMTEDDIADAIKTVRGKHKSS